MTSSTTARTAASPPSLWVADRVERSSVMKARSQSSSMVKPQDVQWMGSGMSGSGSSCPGTTNRASRSASGS